jgi:hypothetical protein
MSIPAVAPFFAVGIVEANRVGGAEFARARVAAVGQVTHSHGGCEHAALDYEPPHKTALAVHKQVVKEVAHALLHVPARDLRTERRRSTSSRASIEPKPQPW